MSLEWDRTAIDRTIRATIRQVAEQAKPVLERRVSGAFTLRLEDTPGGGIALVAGDPRAMVLEYGDGTAQPEPWAMPGLRDAAGGHRGDR